LKGKTEGRLQKYAQQSLTVSYSIYTSLPVFNQADQGKAEGKLLKHLTSTFTKRGSERKKFSMTRRFIQILQLALCDVHIV
jgi:hypothetical protein